MSEKTNAEKYAEKMLAKHGPDWKEIFREAGRRASDRRGPGFAANRELASAAGRKGRQVALERHGEELFVKARAKAWAATRGKKKHDKSTGAGLTVSDGLTAED